MIHLLLEPSDGSVYYNYFLMTKNKEFIIKYQQHPQHMRSVFNFQSKIKAEKYVNDLLDNNYLKIDSKLKKEYDVEFYSWNWYNDDIFIERTPKDIQNVYKENFFKNSILLIDSCEDLEIKKMFNYAKKKGYSNPTDIYDAFGVETITTENLLEDYDEIMECENLQWKIINESYDNDDWQDETKAFENLI
jgi:hypothetical protein